MVSGGQKQGYDVFINYLMQRHSFDDWSDQCNINLIN